MRPGVCLCVSDVHGTKREFGWDCSCESEVTRHPERQYCHEGHLCSQDTRERERERERERNRAKKRRKQRENEEKMSIQT